MCSYRDEWVHNKMAMRTYCNRDNTHTRLS